MKAYVITDCYVCTHPHHTNTCPPHPSRNFVCERSPSMTSLSISLPAACLCATFFSSECKMASSTNTPSRPGECISTTHSTASYTHTHMGGHGRGHAATAVVGIAVKIYTHTPYLLGVYFLSKSVQRAFKRDGRLFEMGVYNSSLFPWSVDCLYWRYDQQQWILFYV